MAFLADNNTCGQTLLKLVARGSSILAELTRLASAVPSIFRLESKADMQKFGDVLLDFGYFQNPELYAKNIEESKVLQQLDNEVKERHMPVLCRLYAAFESIHRYVSQLRSFLQDLSDGAFLHSNFDIVFADHDGKQLMCEALYLYGVQLLLVDRLYPGCCRERIIVAYHRHASVEQRPASDTNIDDVCCLLRSTGLALDEKRPPGYPEDYFRRIELPESYVDQVLGHLRTDDVYSQVNVWPSPEHRWAAYSAQAAMLYVCLYFAPHVLHAQAHTMREVVDRFFPNNWVLCYHMGVTTNLLSAWAPYKAARDALAHTVQVDNVRRVAASFAAQLKTCAAQSEQREGEGDLSEVKVLTARAALLREVRESNVALRWLMLHCAPLDHAGGAASKRCVAVRDQVVTCTQAAPDAVFDLLLSSAGLELRLSLVYRRILQEKDARLQAQEAQAVARLEELAEAFGDDASRLMRLRPNARLRRWFSATAEQVRALRQEEASGAARKLLQIIHALNQVKEYHDLSASGGATQALQEALVALAQLERLYGADDGSLAVLATVADLSYAWRLMDLYTPVMQRRIREAPGEVVRLRAVFLKLASALEPPLLRIAQARSPDALAVSTLYSGHLVAYIRRVLQVIPETMFARLDDIVRLQTNELPDLPTRLDKDKMRELACMPQRYQLCELCHSVGVLAAGVEQMGATLVGVVELHPRQLLEGGVRQELRRRIASILQANLSVLPKKAGGGCLLRQLAAVGRQMAGLRASFEYIQDYVGVYALKIWYEELAAVVSSSVEQECDLLLPGANLPAAPASFLGHIVAEIMRLTDPRVATYVVARGAWYDNTKQRAQVADGAALFARVRDAVAAAGLTGVQKLLACHVTAALKEFVSCVQRLCSSDSALQQLLTTVADSTSPHSNLISDPERQYAAWSSRASPACGALVARLLRIGQLQLLRLHASARLAASSLFEASHLREALHALDLSLMEDLREHHNAPDVLDPEGALVHDPDPEGDLVRELGALLPWVGLTQALQETYATEPCETGPLLPHCLLLLLLHLLPKLRYNAKLGLVAARPSDGVDGAVLCVGVATLLRHGAPDAPASFLGLVAQYLASLVHHQSKTSDGVSNEVATGAAFLHLLARLLQVPRQQLTALLPAQLHTAPC